MKLNDSDKNEKFKNIFHTLISWIEPLFTDIYGKKICFKFKAIIKEILNS